MLFMIPSEQPLTPTFRICLAHLTRLATAVGTQEGAIAVHTKHNVWGSAIEEVLGDHDTKQLLKGSVNLSGIRLHLITEKIRSQLCRGPILAAYVSQRFLAKLLKEDRATDLMFLPWNHKEEAVFFHQHAPQVLFAPEGWAPPTREQDGNGPNDEEPQAPHTVRESLKPEERILPLEHTIDPGFVNHRRIETILGSEGREAISRATARLPPMPEWQRNIKIGHIYSDIMLTFCRTLKVPPLGKLLAEHKGRIFCSTESVGPCRNFYDVDRAVNRWRPLRRKYRPQVEFHYSTAHVTSDTLRSELRRGALLSIVAELYSVTPERIVFHPLVMGGPWLTSQDPKWRTAAEWWGQEFYENVVEDFDEFAAVRDFPAPLSCEPMREISEQAFKHCLAEIIGGEVPKDWGGETSDFYTAHLRFAGKRVSGAFLLKGPARFSPMRLNSLGKNNDQIVRLSNEPADVLFVQHCHEITPPVRATLRAFAVQPSRPRRYCLIDGRDSLWLLQAYGLYDKALYLSKSKVRKRRGVKAA